jgi:propanol-preferring alcohol dehydrogenase
MRLDAATDPTSTAAEPEGWESTAGLTMRALRLHEARGEPRLVEIPTPVPGPGEVLIAVEAAGLCHSDLHLLEWPADGFPYTLPFTLGHETAGRVSAVGPRVRGVAPGDRVVVYSRWGCGRCWACLQGMENRCGRPVGELGAHGAGVGRDGGLADYMLLPDPRYAVPIGDLDAVQAAPMSDAALTPYHAIKRVDHHLRPGTAAVVIGVGGIGHLAIQLLRATTVTRIVAVDVRTQALELATRAGADVAIPAGDLTAAQLRDEVGSGGASVVLDCVASDATLELAGGVVAVGGEICLIGRGGGSLCVSPATLPFECSVSIPSWGGIAELAEVIALATAGAIHVDVERVALEAAVGAYDRLRRGEVSGRVVVTP